MVVAVVAMLAAVVLVVAVVMVAVATFAIVVAVRAVAVLTQSKGRSSVALGCQNRKVQGFERQGRRIRG